MLAKVPVLLVPDVIVIVVPVIVTSPPAPPNAGDLAVAKDAEPLVSI
jgi:hypothetical protein